MDRMRQQNLKPGVVPYTSLGMPCLCCRLHAHRSRACDYEVITYPHHPPSLPLKVDACCRIGDLETGFSLLRRMMWQDRVQPNAITCSALINGCGKKGEIDAALQVIMRTKKKPSCSSLCGVSSQHNSSTYTLLCFVSKVLRFMLDSGLKPSKVVYTCLLTACAKLRRDDCAAMVIIELWWCTYRHAPKSCAIFIGLTMC